MINRENSKNELKSDVNSRLKSDPIIGIDFSLKMIAEFYNVASEIQ